MKYYNDPEHSLTDEEKIEMYVTAKLIADRMREYVETAKKKGWNKNSAIIEWLGAWEKGQQDIRNRRLERIIERGDQETLEDYSGA